MRRGLAVVVALMVAAILAVPASADAQSRVTVHMTGAGTVLLEPAAGTSGTARSCPDRPPLANPDNGPAVLACEQDWSPTCAPAAGAPSCPLQLKATARVPGAPDLDDSELGGWRFLKWTEGACAQSTTATCTVTIGSCTARDACTYLPAGLTAAFDDVRAPTAFIVDGPPELVTDPNGVTAFLLRSNEYAQLETSTLQCQLDAAPWVACPARPASFVLTGVAEGPHTLRVRATDPSGRLQTTAPQSVSWTQRYPPVTTFDSGPAEGAVVAATDATFAFHADRRVRFECRLDDQEELEACTSPYAATGLAEGRHELEVRAIRTDVGAAEVASVVKRAWTVDTTPPQTVILTGPDGDTTARSATFTFRPDPADDPVRLSCALDDAPLSPCDAGTVTFTGLAPGSHRLVVQAVDAAGNVEEPAQERFWTILVDGDGDGSPEGEDCDDANPAAHPFQTTDVPNDGVDADCDGVDGFDDFGFGTDADGDGDFARPDGDDCDDSDPDANSFGFEVPQNGVDEDCDGEDAILPGAGVRFDATWDVTRGGSRLLRLTARSVARGTRLRITLDCPRRTCRDRVKQTQVQAKRKQLSLLPYLGGRLTLPPRAVLEVRASRRERNPEGRTWRIRNRKAPRSAEFCVRGTVREAGRC